MVKTKTQSANITIKKEEEQDSKPILVLHSVRIVPRNSSKITKRKPSKSKRNLPPTQEVKVEQDIDVMSLLGASSTLPSFGKGRTISQEQINQLIDYVVNHGIGVYKAAFKVKTSYHTALYFYNAYKNDPEKKIPVPLQKPKDGKRIYTQEQISQLIKPIVDDDMTTPAAAIKANTPYRTALAFITYTRRV